MRSAGVAPGSTACNAACTSRGVRSYRRNMIGNGRQQQPERTWKVGALAKATGLTVRTLHHYDEIRLLRPSARLAGGHRLYDAHDVARLSPIIRLRQLRFPP